MSLADIYADPLFPFETYFSDPNAYIGAQRFWLAILREAAGDKLEGWEPAQKAVDLKDDMHTGLVVDLKNAKQLKSVLIYTRSLPGLANFIRVENQQTIEAMAAFKGEMPPPPDLPPLPTGDAETTAQAEAELTETDGFEADIEPREFYDASRDAAGLEPMVAGHQLVLMSTITDANRQRATETLADFMREPEAPNKK